MFVRRQGRSSLRWTAAGQCQRTQQSFAAQAALDAGQASRGRQLAALRLVAACLLLAAVAALAAVFFILAVRRRRRGAAACCF